jgi:carbon-monoxide dehydrogenase small subunit
MKVAKRTLQLTVNGTSYELDVPVNRTLIEVLRRDLHLTGTKSACNEGECGACTVHMNGRSVNACLVLAVEADGSRITTIEGIARPGELHPLQQAFIEEGAVQCGYCTPGMIMQALDLLARNPSPREHEIREGMAGNLCRCTGYEQIVRAISTVASGARHERFSMIKEALRRKEDRVRKAGRKTVKGRGKAGGGKKPGGRRRRS